MFRKTMGLVLLVVVSSAASAQPAAKLPTIRFPMLAEVQPKTEPTKLTGDLLYVVYDDAPFFILESPEGLVTVTEKSGPLTLGGKFIDGTGKLEFRDYKAKQIWIIQAAGKGTVTLHVVPHGATKKTDTIRKVLDVDGDEVVQPPPPPKDKVAKSLTFVVFIPTVKNSAVTEDQGFRDYLKKQGIGVFAIRTQAQLDANPKFAGVPNDSIALQDDQGTVIAHTRITTVNEAILFVGQHTKGK